MAASGLSAEARSDLPSLVLAMTNPKIETTSSAKIAEIVWAWLANTLTLSPTIGPHSHAL